MEPMQTRSLILVALLLAAPATLRAGDPLPPSTLDFGRLVPATIPRSAVFRQEGWCLWDPCVVRGDDGRRQEFQRLEMPKLLLEDGRPRLLSLAAQPAESQDSFLVVIPLRRASEN